MPPTFPTPDEADEAAYQAGEPERERLRAAVLAKLKEPSDAKGQRRLELLVATQLCIIADITEELRAQGWDVRIDNTGGARGERDLVIMRHVTPQQYDESS